MAYNKQTWTDGPGGGTPISAARLNKMEDGIAASSGVSGAPLTRWHTALATRYMAPAKVQVWGDSVTEGVGATQIPRRWVERLSHALYARFPGAGTPQCNYLPARFVAPTTPQSAVLAGNATFDDGWGFGRRSVVLQSGASATYTVVGTSADVAWLRYPGNGSFTIKVDGTVLATVNTDGAQADGQLTRVTLGALGSHTVTITHSAGSYVFHTGLRLLSGNESAGIHVYEGGHAGYDAFSFRQSPFDVNHVQAATALGADLVIIALGVNSWRTGGTPIEDERALLGALVNSAKALPSAPAVLVMAQHETTPSNQPIPWATWVEMQRGVATAASCSFLDLSQRLPSVPTATPGLYVDTVHPSDLVHGLIGEIVASAISPS